MCSAFALGAGVPLAFFAAVLAFFAGAEGGGEPPRFWLGMAVARGGASGLRTMG